jgi:hypothetical protein
MVSTILNIFSIIYYIRDYKYNRNLIELVLTLKEAYALRL